MSALGIVTIHLHNKIVKISSALNRSDWSIWFQLSLWRTSLRLKQFRKLLVRFSLFLWTIFTLSVLPARRVGDIGPLQILLAVTLSRILNGLSKCDRYFKRVQVWVTDLDVGSVRVSFTLVKWLQFSTTLTIPLQTFLNVCFESSCVCVCAYRMTPLIQ